MEETPQNQGPAELRARFYAGLAGPVAAFVQRAAAQAAAQNTPLYLVGGPVRDLLLGHNVLDIDLVLQSDAVDFVVKLTEGLGLHVGHSAAFRNAKVDIAPMPGAEPQHIDFVTARREMYPKPGLLPRVWPGTLAQDLARRDFTINTIALPLDPPGALLDPFNGSSDLAAGLVRVLHDRSFRDDPTRIFRAVRYEQRFGFALERHTLNLLQNAVKRGMIELLTPDRVRHELERSLQEANAFPQLQRLAELGALEAIDPALIWDERMAQEFGQAAAQRPGARPLLALLLYRLGAEERERTAKRLGLDKDTIKLADDLARLDQARAELLSASAKASELDRLFSGVSVRAMDMAATAWRATPAGERLEQWRTAPAPKPTLTGDDLKKLGLTPGPAFRDLLAALRAAVVDGRISGRDQELAFASAWAKEHGVG